MNEIYELKQEISNLKLQLQHKKLNQSANNNVCEKDENQIRVLSKKKSAIKRWEDDKITDDRNDFLSK